MFFRICWCSVLLIWNYLNSPSGTVGFFCLTYVQYIKYCVNVSEVFKKPLLFMIFLLLDFLDSTIVSSSIKTLVLIYCFLSLAQEGHLLSGKVKKRNLLPLVRLNIPICMYLGMFLSALLFSKISFVSEAEDDFLPTLHVFYKWQLEELGISLYWQTIIFLLG